MAVITVVLLQQLAQRFDDFQLRAGEFTHSGQGILVAQPDPRRGLAEILKQRLALAANNGVQAVAGEMIHSIHSGRATATTTGLRGSDAAARSLAINSSFHAIPKTNTTTATSVA